MYHEEGEVEQSQDRRHSLRYPCEVEVVCRGGQSRFSAQTRNISTGGISVVLDSESQGQLVVELPAELGHQERTVNVIHRREILGNVVLGGEFTEPLQAEDQLAALILKDKPIILVVEEEEGIRRLLMHGLKLYKFNVWPVASGLNAVAVYRHHHDAIALALIDVGMKSLDGPRTLAALQEINSGVQCLFMTGGGAKYTKEELLDMGAARVLEKPFNVSQVVSELKSLGLD